MIQPAHQWNNRKCAKPELQFPGEGTFDLNKLT